MARLTPLTTELALALNSKGKLQLLHRGTTVPGVLRVEVHQDFGKTSTVQVTISGAAVRFETEAQIS